MRNDVIRFTVDLEMPLAESFGSLVDIHGWKKVRAVRAAMRGFLAMPVDVQVKLMASNNTTDVYRLLIEGLLEAEIAKELQKLGPDKKEFLDLVRQAKAKISRKK